MSPALYILVGAALGVAIGLNLRPDGPHCCEQLEQLVRADVRKRCGPLADICEGLGGALGLFDQSSALLDFLKVTT